MDTAPEKNKETYTDEHGKVRSPWYDAECKRCAHPQEVAQEHDIDFSGSDYQFFDTKMLDEIEREVLQTTNGCR